MTNDGISRLLDIVDRARAIGYWPIGDLAIAVLLDKFFEESGHDQQLKVVLESEDPHGNFLGRIHQDGLVFCWGERFVRRIPISFFDFDIAITLLKRATKDKVLRQHIVRREALDGEREDLWADLIEIVPIAEHNRLAVRFLDLRRMFEDELPRIQTALKNRPALEGLAEVNRTMTRLSAIRTW